MTYRSKNPFDANDYSNFAFKKSELLEVLQAIDNSFSFEENDSNEQNSINISKNESIATPQYDYKFFLFKKPLLTFHEASCIMTGYDPRHVDLCQNDTNFEQFFSDYLGAKDYLDSCVDAHCLAYDTYNNKLEAESFKQFLANEKTFIAGFNDNLISDKTTRETEHESGSLNAEILRLRELIAIKDVEIEQLKKDIEKAQGDSFIAWVDQTNAEKEAVKLKEQIKQLESNPSFNQSEQSNLLDLIFDDAAQERYAPDLALSIKLWEDLYIKNPKDDSHSNRANKWIDANTGYGDTSKSKLREITTPLVNWSTLRDKNYKK